VGVGELMFVKLAIEILGVDRVALKGEAGNGVGEVMRGLLGFVALVCVWVYFCCCSIGCFCQGL
jgi:hypothetical protein